MPKRLLVLAGPDEGRTFAIPAAESLLVGRSRATDMCLIDPHVSRVHCQVQVEDGHTVVSDFDSPGGTWVNGKRIAKQALHPGDLIRIGNTRLQYLDDEGESAFVALTYGLPHELEAEPLDELDVERGLRDTVDWWQEWSSRCAYDGPYREHVLRSALGEGDHLAHVDDRLGGGGRCRGLLGPALIADVPLPEHLQRRDA